MSPVDPTVAAATGRTPGYDVARAFAVLGMVLVNFHGMVETDLQLFDLTAVVMDELEGRSAALFVLLAGLGVSLRSRRARLEGGPALARERVALLRRALALLGLGILNLHLWEWDILHVYGLYLTFAAGMIGASNRALFGVGSLVFGAAVALRLVWMEPVEPPFWSAPGMFHSIVYSGNYPAFPWLCFLLLGLGLGRLDLRQSGLRRRILAASGLVIVVAELAARLAARWGTVEGLDEGVVQWMSTWPRPPGPFFVLSSGAVAVWVTAMCVEWGESSVAQRFILPLTATGQLALSLYLAHEVAILIPLQHDWFVEAPLEGVVLWALVFFGFGVAGATWWRRRNRQGPFEAILRQISARSQPAWGGGLMERTAEK